jgi:hypothetical protein
VSGANTRGGAILSERQAVGLFVLVVAIVLVPFVGGVNAVADNGQQEAEAIIGRLKELLAATETKVIVVPFPDSRSRVLKADGSSDFFLFIERGNLRGMEPMNSFYAALESGDMAIATEIFTQNSMVSMRASDYGWNGLGVPMERMDGSGQIQDRLYKTKEGAPFGQVDITPEDTQTFLEYVETILIPALEGGF